MLVPDFLTVVANVEERGLIVVDVVVVRPRVTR